MDAPFPQSVDVLSRPAVVSVRASLIDNSWEALLGIEVTAILQEAHCFAEVVAVE